MLLQTPIMAVIMAARVPRVRLYSFSSPLDLALCSPTYGMFKIPNIMAVICFEARQFESDSSRKDYCWRQILLSIQSAKPPATKRGDGRAYRLGDHAPNT